MKKQPTMNEDIEKYPIFMIYNREIIPIDWIKSTSNYNHYVYQLNHFIRKSVRKNTPDFYSRVEHLQKLILMPAQMNYDLETMGEDTFFKRYGIEKHKLLFNRKLWRANYYEQESTTNATTTANI